MVRSHLSIGLEHYHLAQGQDVDGLKSSIEAAVRGGGAFVDFVVVGNRSVSVLFTPAVPVIFTVETVPFDSRDTGNTADPFGGFFDDLEL